MMQNGSCECSKSELNVLSVPPTMTAMQESQWVEHFPIASLTNNAPIEFIFTSNGTLDRFITIVYVCQIQNHQDRWS